VGGTFAGPGAAACALAPAGTFSGASAPAVTMCPLGTWSAAAGAASAATCTACPAGSTTTATGAFSAEQCIKGVFVCPLGFQPAAGDAPPVSLAQCAPLVCPWPLRPAAAALAPSGSDAAFAASAACAGCGVGTAGTPGGCAPCGDDEFCPGLTSRPLWNFSLDDGLRVGAAAGGGGGARALAGARPAPWAACPRLLAPTAAAGGDSRGPVYLFSVLVTRRSVALGAGMAIFLLFISCAFVLMRTRLSLPQQIARFLRFLDLYAMNHDLAENQVQRKRATPLGGVCSLAALTLVAVCVPRTHPLPPSPTVRRAPPPSSPHLTPRPTPLPLPGTRLTW
jgi:hypothetical protein